ncbi:exopolysaccharide biosynthesis polyprenyl glycosylphosphotransferase [Maribacter algarum]|nr:exopolysaccharide biosynthesis polyprenyl glycosylphosphotransferase [Maribacter algarum]
MNSKNRFVLVNLLAIEFILLNFVLVVFLYFKLPQFSFNDTGFLLNMVKLGTIYNLSWLFIILYIRDNEFYFNADYRYMKNVLTSLFFFIGIVTTLALVFRIDYFVRSTFIIPIFIFSYLILISAKYLLRFLKDKGSHLFSNTLLIGSGYKGNNLTGFINAMTQYGYNVMGYLEDRNVMTPNDLDLSVSGEIDDLPDVLRDYSIDEIFVSMSDVKHEKIAEVIKVADDFGVRIKLIPENPLLMSKNYKAFTMGELAVFKLRQSPLDNFSLTILKRLFDFLFAFFILIAFAPIFLLIAILIYLDNRGPIFYTPYRKGEANRTFKCYKFRTMSVCEDPMNGTKSTEVNDPRITRVGKFLRKLDLDELPQFFNVLKGDMSVIGPRPHRIHLQNDFRSTVKNYMVRSYVKPGITGWAQVNGWRGPTVTEEQKNERVHHDLWYIENWSFWLDVKIIFMTVFGGHHKKAF